jgi:hypothetical protein
MDWAALLKRMLPLVLALAAGGAGGGTLGYQERDADFERVVAKYKVLKHELAECLGACSCPAMTVR